MELEPIAVAPSRVAPLLGSLRASGVHSDIGGPDESGTFPWSWFPPAGVVVVDANALRSDVLYGCRKGRRTTLVTAANEGLLRLYAAAHVVEEVAEHYVRWAADGPVSASAFWQRWQVRLVSGFGWAGGRWTCWGCRPGVGVSGSLLVGLGRDP